MSNFDINKEIVTPIMWFDIAVQTHEISNSLSVASPLWKKYTELERNKETLQLLALEERFLPAGEHDRIVKSHL